MNMSLKDQIIKGVSNKVEDKLLNLEARPALAILSSKDSPESIPDDGKSRAMYAALGALTGLAASGLIVPFVTRNKFKFPMSEIIAITGQTALAGATLPEVHKAAIAMKRGHATKQDAIAQYKSSQQPSIHFGKEFSELVELNNECKAKSRDMNKVAGSFLGTALKRGSIFAGKTTGKLGKEYVSALTNLPWRGGLGQRTFGLAVKGATGYGIYRGAKGLNRRYGGPQSGQNYTTFLRNQVLAGNIQPSELSQPDLISVRKLGLK